MPRIVGIAAAARQAGISEELLQLWVSTGRIVPTSSTPKQYLPVPDRPNEQREDFMMPAAYGFSAADIEQIRALAEKPAVEARNSISAASSQRLLHRRGSRCSA